MKRSSAQYFDGLANQWQGLYESKSVFRDRLDLFLSKLARSVPAPARILDVGCGPGVMSLALARMNYTVVGVDAAPNMIRQAEAERRRLKITNAEFAVMEASGWVFEKASFDAVICSSVVQYIPDDRRFLEETADVLRPNGLLLVSVPHRGSLLSVAECLSARAWRNSDSPGRGFLDHTLRLYGKRDFLRLLASSSFNNCECTFFECPLLGNLGIALSRIGWVGMMLLVAARRAPHKLHGDQPAISRSSMARSLPPRAVSRKNLWESLNPRAKWILGQAATLVSPELTLGGAFRSTRRLIDDAQWWSAERARAYQLHQLKRIISLAYEKTSYYRRAFQEIGFEPGDLKSLSDMSMLPTIEKRTIQNHLYEMRTPSPNSTPVDYTSTGGSSGTPLHFYIGADRSAIEYAYLVSSWGRVGYDLKAPQAVFRSQIVPENSRGLRHSYDPLLRRHYYSNFHMTDENMARYLEHIRSIGPCFLHVYPSSVAALTRFVKRSGIPVPRNIRGILAGSENVFADVRKIVEDTFGCRYFSWYGHSEKLVMAAECEHSTDYHVWPTYGYFELLDEAGRPVNTPGQRGEIVGTGFINNVMPFIRYRTGDFATYVSDRCSACGRHHPIIRDIRGHRAQEMLVAADGSEISWTAMNMHDDTFVRVRQFQFYQDTPGNAVLNVVPGDGYTEEDGGRILARLERKLQGRLAVSIHVTDAIPLSERGKTIYVDQRIPNVSTAGVLSGLDEATVDQR